MLNTETSVLNLVTSIISTVNKKTQYIVLNRLKKWRYGYDESNQAQSWNTFNVPVFNTKLGCTLKTTKTELENEISSKY